MWFHANWRNIVALRFAGHRTIEMLGLVAPKTGANLVEVPRKRTQHVGRNNVVCCWPQMLLPFDMYH